MAEMGEFNPAHALRDVDARRREIATGQRIVPVAAAVIAVLAALATLFAHHSSILALALKNEAVLLQTKSVDQYNYYESKRVRADLMQALIDADLVPKNSAGRAKMEQRIAGETSDADSVLSKAKALESQASDSIQRSERFVGSYENYQVAATLFEVSIILVSITALSRTKAFLYVAAVATLVGLGFLTVGFLH